jgi:hypothetical protein
MREEASREAIKEDAPRVFPSMVDASLLDVVSEIRF